MPDLSKRRLGIHVILGLLALVVPAALVTRSYLLRETFVADPAPPASTLDRAPTPLE